jgi:hypothetical protein
MYITEQIHTSIDCLARTFPVEIISLFTGYLHSSLVLWRLTVQPDSNKRHKAAHHTPQPCNPDPASRNPPAPWPLVMRKMSYGDLSFLIDIGQEGSFVVDFEGKDAVLVR